MDGLRGVTRPLHPAWHPTAPAKRAWGGPPGAAAAQGDRRGARGAQPEGQLCADGGQPEGKVWAGLLRGDDRGQPPTDGKVTRPALPSFLWEQRGNRLGMRRAGP